MQNRVGILCGGAGYEAPVSLTSARFIFENFPKEYRPFFLYMAEDGLLHIFLNSEFIRCSGNLSTAARGDRGFQICDLKRELSTMGLEGLFGLFPILHGSPGEDGLCQAAFSQMGVLVAGSSFRSSLLCYDKSLCKMVLKQNGIPVVEELCLYREKGNHSRIQEYFQDQVIYIKPSREGSSVGVFRIKPGEDRLKALKQCFQYDSKVIVEPEVSGRELEVAILEGENGEWICSRVGEIFKNGAEFYSFEAKYDENSSVTTGLASLDEALSNRLRDLSVEAAKILEIGGFARIDFFLDEKDHVYLNEVNTLPGCTSISMFPQLMKDLGIPPSDWIRSILSKLA